MAQSQPEGDKVAQPAPTPASAAEDQAPNKTEDTAANGTATGGPDTVEETSKADKDAPVKTQDTAANDTTEGVSNETAAAAEEKKDEKKADDKPKDRTEDQNTDEKAAENTLPGYLANNKPLSDLFDALPSVIEKAGNSEMWGVHLKDSDDPPTVIILMKYLRANEGDAKAASQQLTKALEWRKKMNPLTLTETTFAPDKFKDLGFVTTYEGEKSGRAVFTWNVYGSVKDIKKTFGDVDEFIKWRVALMELAVRDLKIGEATTVMDYDGEDPYQMFQVHDYGNVSFLRMDPAIRKATRETIDKFSMAYPELLREKYFVNVPAIMGWVYGALKMLLSKNTVRKFHPMANGASLAGELPGYQSEIPKDYGGKGKVLAEQGRTPALNIGDSKPAKDETSPAAAEPEPSKSKSCHSGKTKETSATTKEAAKSDEPPQASTETPAPAAASAEQAAKPDETPQASTETPAPAAASAEPAKGDTSEAPTAK